MRTLLLVAGAIAIGCTAADAQTPAATFQLPRADAHFVIGWQHLKKDQPGNRYDNWLNQIFYGGAGAGWFWTDHLKTQVDIGAGTRATRTGYEERFLNGAPTYRSAALSVQQWAVTVSQQYQFFRNQWFHPRVGAGVELAHETTSSAFEPFSVYDPVSRTSRLVAPEIDGPDTSLITRGVGEVGFKAYVARRAFFTADMRLMFRNGIDQVLFRTGFGFDF
jgi:opacity protein-like surface antigen